MAGKEKPRSGISLDIVFSMYAHISSHERMGELLARPGLTWVVGSEDTPGCSSSALWTSTIVGPGARG